MHPSIEFDTPVTHEIIAGILDAIQKKKPVFLQGPSGAGKDFFN